ncbi:hypothetical protein AOQ84DRAFT_387322 [Glonium stellatum]|uniref:Rhodopsin domain-containing protein n=1 Tax=Glonium stellatum TaxID=574774 RepID=A0A8E2F522_9PEZI|nr:hypothetical protein AOQ84DRAFT_387322 [Glonium stellatum]
MTQAHLGQTASWLRSNHDNSVTRVAAVLGVLISTTGLMLLFVVGRLYSRTLVSAAFGLDDWIMTAAAVIASLITLLGCIECNYGSGYHIWDIKPEWEFIYSKIAYVAVILFALCVGFTKISIGITYLRIFPSRSNRIFCHCLIVFLLCWIIASVFAEIFQCAPVGSFWDVANKTKDCINLEAYLYGTAASNSVTDVIIYVWPVWQLRKIQLPPRRRFSLLFAFTTGCIVCVAGIIRMWHFSVYFTSTDPFWEGAMAWIIPGIEYNLGIICGCLPGIKPLLVSAFPDLFGPLEHGTKVYSQSRIQPQILPFQTLCTAEDGAIMCVTVADELCGSGAAWPRASDDASRDPVSEGEIRIRYVVELQVEATNPRGTGN